MAVLCRRAAASTLAILAILAVVAPAAPAAAQPCGPRWLPGSAIPGVNGQVNATVLWDPDGSGPQTPIIVLGGSFTTAGGAPASRIAAWDPVTGQWSTFGTGLSHTVNALTVLPDGELVAGGLFSGRVARWDGAAWLRIGPAFGATAPDQVNAMTVLPNGDLVAAGAAGSGNTIARWDGSAWSTIGGGTNNLIFDVLALPDGDLIIGGAFSTAGGVPALNIARWDSETLQWTALGTGPGEMVSSVIAMPNGDIVAGRSRVSRWDGSTWTVLGVCPSERVSELLLLPSGEILVGGGFPVISGVAANGAARWDGAAWHPLGEGLVESPAASPGRINNMTLLSDGRVVCAGNFTHAGHGIANNAAIWDSTGWSALAGGANDGVLAMAVSPAGDLVAAGRFTSIDGVPAKRIASWDGAAWSPLGSGLSAQSSGTEVRAVTFAANGDLLAGGHFLILGEQPSRSIARWNGSEWAPLGAWTSGIVNALATLPNGDIIAAGNFSMAGGVSARNIARWDGSAWSPLGLGLAGEINSTLYALAVLPNGDLVAAGHISGPNGVPATNVARWTGSSWAPLGPFGSSFVHRVRALAVLPNGDLVAGGLFPNAAGTPANNIARWNGVSWSPLGDGTDSMVTALAVMPNGNIVAGGDFTMAGGIPASRIAVWDGATWSPLASGVTVSGILGAPSVSALAVLPSGELVAGGNFTHAGGTPSAFLARWTESNSPWFIATPQDQQTTIGGNAGFTVVAASGYGDLDYDWNKDGAPLADGPTPHGSIISGAATPTLLISNARPEDAGHYAAKVAGDCGFAESSPAELTLTGGPACPADWDGDTMVNLSDISAYLTTWLADVTNGTTLADFDASGQTSSSDISAFLTAWLDAVQNGC